MCSYGSKNMELDLQSLFGLNVHSSDEGAIDQLR